MSKIRDIVRKNVLDILGLKSHPAPGIHILNGHRIQKELEPDTFREILRKLSEETQFVNIQDAVREIIRKNRPPIPLVAFTFDDGFSECYDIFAPLLDEYGVKAAFFINPNYVDGDSRYIEHFNTKVVMTPDKRPMTWPQIKELADRGHIIGAHTMDHFMINTDDVITLELQIGSCKHVIEGKTGHPCEYFAFPYGKLSHANETAIRMALQYYPYVFSQSDYKHYTSFGGVVINRRHFEPFWPVRHIKYFLSHNKKF